ncbi:MAG: hypothetical protein GX571_06995 [Lentisphaerae bacterium]|nr:hypothetical protein [Lentisphaerota bacterium]
MSDLNPLYKDPTAPIDERVEDLLRRMTVREKVAQMRLVRRLDIDENARETCRDGYGASHANADLASPGGLNAIQRFLREETRLGIPLLMAGESLHGIRDPGGTVFPQAIALGATFDDALVGEIAEAIGAEARAAGIRQVFAPNLDLARDPRWGRVEETYGEDTYLAAAFREGGAMSTMPCYSELDGEPVHASRRLLNGRRGALRLRRGSRGLVYGRGGRTRPRGHPPRRCEPLRQAPNLLPALRRPHPLLLQPQALGLGAGTHAGYSRRSRQRLRLLAPRTALSLWLRPLLHNLRLRRPPRHARKPAGLRAAGAATRRRGHRACRGFRHGLQHRFPRGRRGRAPLCRGRRLQRDALRQAPARLPADPPRTRRIARGLLRALLRRLLLHRPADEGSRRARHLHPFHRRPRGRLHAYSLKGSKP